MDRHLAHLTVSSIINEPVDSAMATKTLAAQTILPSGAAHLPLMTVLLSRLDDYPD